MLALDVSKATLTCTLIDPTTRRLLWEREVPNSPAGYQDLLQRTPPEHPWVLEPTGRYSLSVAQEAKAAGRNVLLASPRKARLFLASIQSRAKTDRLDSRGLAQYALAHELPPYPVNPAPVETLHQHLSARKGVSLSLSRLRQQRAALPLAAAALDETITLLEEQLKKIEAQIQALVAEKTSFPSVTHMEAVPGIGKVTAAAVAARLTARSFGNGDQFVAYVGLDVAVRQSGKSKGQRGLTRQGDAELRRLLYLCAQASVRSKRSPFRAQFERERAKGLSKTAAYCAVARKLARLCWSMHTHGTEYDPARVYQPRS
jgi:transposase